MSPHLVRRRIAATVVSAVVVVAGVAGWVVSPWGPSGLAAQPSGPVVLATGAATGLSDRYGLALAGSSDDRLGAVRTLVTAGSQENLDRLVQGDASFALATADVVEEYLATRPPAREIRAVARLYDSYVHLVVPAHKEVHRLADLRGQRVAVGVPGSGDGLAADRVLAAAGLNPATDVTRLELGPDAAVAALATGSIDAYLMVDGIPSPQLEQLTNERLVDLADVAEALLGSGTCPRPVCAVYHAGTVPATTYPGLAVAITTVAVPTLLLTTTEVGDDVVRQFTKLVFDTAPRIAAAIPAARQIDRRSAIFTGPVPLHDGARYYYRAAKVAV